MANEVTKILMETILALITTAFTLVTAESWNSAIQAFIESFIGAGDAIPSLFTYAIIVTIIAVIVTVLIARIAGKMGVETE